MVVMITNRTADIHKQHCNLWNYPSVTPSHGWFIQKTKMVEVRIMKFLPHDSPICLVLCGMFHQEILTGSPEQGCQTRDGWKN